MRRPLYILMIVAGVVVGAFGLHGALTRHTTVVPSYAAQAPSTTTVALTRGTWGIFVQAGTGLDGTPATFATLTVHAPGGANIILTPTGSTVNVQAHGVRYVESYTLKAASAGGYQVVAGSPTNVTTARADVPVAVLITRPPRSRFPWYALVVDGVVLVALGAGLLVLDNRRRRQVLVLEAAYAAAGPVS